MLARTGTEREIASDGLRISVLDTPGHTADSVCFLAKLGNARAMFTGDTILGRGSTVVAAPDGDLGSYLDSLTVLTAYENVLMLPGHGPGLSGLTMPPLIPDISPFASVSTMR